MAKAGKRTLVAGAVTLALAGAVTRGIGAVYHIVAVRVAGPEALGLFQMAMPIYRLASGVASIGFHVAVVRLISASSTHRLSPASFAERMGEGGETRFSNCCTKHFGWLEP